MTKWISYTYTYIPTSPHSCISLPPSLSHPSRWSQSTELISLCYAAASHLLSILHLVVYISPCHSKGLRDRVLLLTEIWVRSSPVNGPSPESCQEKIVTVFWGCCFLESSNPPLSLLVTTRVLFFTDIMVVRLLAFLRVTTNLGKKGWDYSKLKLYKAHLPGFSHFSSISTPQIVASLWLISSFEKGDLDNFFSVLFLFWSRFLKVLTPPLWKCFSFS